MVKKVQESYREKLKEKVLNVEIPASGDEFEL